MVEVKFTTHLQRYFPALQRVEAVHGDTVAEVLANLEARFPGLAAYLVDERGALRPHVNIFIGEEMIQDRQGLKDTVASGDRLFVFQALSGGSNSAKERNK